MDPIELRERSQELELVKRIFSTNMSIYNGSRSPPIQNSPVFTQMKDTWHIKHLKVKKMPHQNIIYLHPTHPFHSATTSIHKPTSHVHQQSWQTDGKVQSEWCRRSHPLPSMATNSNATKVLRLLYFYFLFS